MPRVMMHKWTLDAGENPDVLVAENVLVQIDWSEGEVARLAIVRAAIRKLLGGREDASAEAPAGGATLFRRLDPNAPGGVGWMVSGQLISDAN